METPKCTHHTYVLGVAKLPILETITILTLLSKESVFFYALFVLVSIVCQEMELNAFLLTFLLC